MSIDYCYNVGYGFLLPLNKFALPAEWNNRELWYTGDLEGRLSGSGLTAVLGGNHMGSDELWGFMATDTMGRMSRYNNTIIEELRDVDPAVVSNLFDIRTRVKRPKARIGWTMWADIS